MNIFKSKKLLFVSVFLLSSIYYSLSTVAYAASLYFYPQSVTLSPGEEVLVDIRIDTAGKSINAVELEGALSGVAATMRNIDNSGSALGIFVEAPTVKGKSAFRLVGGAPAGLSGEKLLARIALRAEIPGTSILSFTPGKTRVLLADGTGNGASLKFLDTTIKVLSKPKDYIAISSLSHPDQNQWYATDKAQLQFTFDPKSSYSYLVTLDPLAEPDGTADKPEGAATWNGETKLEDLPEGVSYFVVKKIGSTSVSRYRLMNDTSKPAWVEVKKNNGAPETEGRPFLTFLASDAISGVEYYEMRVNASDPVTVASPQPLPDEYKILSLRAYDRAGNYIEEFIPGPKKDYSIWVWVAILFVLLVWVSGIIGESK